jgi:hypothetical protein
MTCGWSPEGEPTPRRSSGTRRGRDFPGHSGPHLDEWRSPEAHLKREGFAVCAFEALPGSWWTCRPHQPAAFLSRSKRAAFMARHAAHARRRAACAAAGLCLTHPGLSHSHSPLHTPFLRRHSVTHTLALCAHPPAGGLWRRRRPYTHARACGVCHLCTRAQPSVQRGCFGKILTRRDFASPRVHSVRSPHL